MTGFLKSLGKDTDKIMNPKTICFVVNTDWYFELHWLERALAAKKSGYRIDLVTHFHDSALLLRLTRLGIICHHCDIAAHSYNPFALIFTLHSISKVLNKIKPDIIHCITIKPCLIGGLYAKFNGVNLVLSFVGLGRVFSDSTFTLRAIKKIITPIYKFIFKNNKAKLLFEHEKDRDELILSTNVPISKTMVINGAGVDTNIYTYRVETERNLLKVLFASRLLKSKGLVDLIEAKKILSNEGIYFEIDVAGIITANDRDAISLKDIQKWDEEGKINWLGRSGDVAQLIANANLVILPSVYYEGVPRILLEAAASGRAIISYDSGGCSSLIKNNINGFILPKGDVNALAERIKYLIENPEIRYRMGKDGRRIILETFDSKIVISKTLQLYNSF
jgi:glycosyltransferase involved in cell wall biosynthesis